MGQEARGEGVGTRVGERQRVRGEWGEQESRQGGGRCIAGECRCRQGAGVVGVRRRWGCSWGERSM